MMAVKAHFAAAGEGCMPPRTGSDGLNGEFAAGAAAALAEILAARRKDLPGTQNAAEGQFEGDEPFIFRKGDQLVAELLAFAGRQVLVPSRVEVLPFLCSLAHLLRQRLDARIQVLVEVDRECLAWRIDRFALEEALNQLALNASDAMPKGGRLVFRASVDRLSCTEGTTLDIVDTGAGMSAAVLRMAVRPFFTTKEGSSLSGMGLPSVLGFAAQSGGGMFISSVVGRGTTVTMMLPTFESHIEPESEPGTKSRG